MNRSRVWIEYERILNDVIDWLEDGYQGERVEKKEAARGSKINTPLKASQKVEPEASRSSADAKKGNPDFRIAGHGKTSEDEASFASRYGGELERIAREVRQCERCSLYLIRENTVFGIGTENPLLMIVTAAPVFGAKEADGPLSPYESEYLDKWLKALDLRPGLDTFITPAVKCRTPGGRPPDARELGECFQYLKREFAELKPKAILALGATACGALTGDISDFPSLVGKPWTWEGVPSLVLWTPAEVLENPTRLRKPVWDALQRLRDAWNALPRASV